MSIDDTLSFLLNQEKTGQERVQLLDQLTMSIKANAPNVKSVLMQSKEAHEIWRKLKDDNYFWYFSSEVIRLSTVDETKVFMLVILEDAIKSKWNALPQEQKDSIKNFIVNIVIEYGGMEGLPKTMQNILSKVNSILVQIVKYEWNTTWPNFINDICSASLKDMNICENNFSVLKMLSEEIFEYSKNQMTQEQIRSLKAQMNNDFTTILNLCMLILQNMGKAKPSLIRACLETLNAFLNWIPIFYIVNSDLIDRLVSILHSDYHRNHALQCLVEIAGLPVEAETIELKVKLISMLKNTTFQLNKIIPLRPKEDIPKLLSSVKKSQRQVFEILARQIVLFYSEFFKNQYKWLQVEAVNNEQIIEACRIGLSYMNMFMQIDDQSVFKIAIEFYHFLVGHHLEERNNPTQTVNVFNGSQKSLASIYPQVFNEVMQVISLRMAKPEEVLIVIDETGYPVREQLEDTENSSLYEIMKELAAFLANYDWQEMRKFILGEIQKQNGPDFHFDRLNSLSWIVGSLCGSIAEKEEKTFFIGTLRTLLHLCDMKRGKENKAVIASCIMYVVGQYPTFLRNNWSFLKTVVRKLFEFMKEDFPGIMDMACNAFLKIVKTTADQFVILQTADSQPYIHDIIQRIPEETKKLKADSLKLIFYQSVGYLISAEKNPELQLDMMKETLGSYFFQFQSIMASAQTNPAVLRQEECEQKILYFLKINENLAVGVGQQYVMMLELIDEIINKIYLYYSGEVNDAVQKNGKHVLNFMTIKMMRAVKKQIIRIYINYLQRCNNLNQEQAGYILKRFIFPLGTLLKDFQDCLPETKEQEFVSLFTLVLEKLGAVITPDFLSKLLEMIFASSLPLITTDFNSFPEIRASFFAFLKALIKYSFGLLYSLDQNHFDTILNCVVWSFRHELSNYSDLGLQLIEDILNNVNKQPNIVTIFYGKYHLRLLTDILEVMTDGFHKSGLEAQSKIFYLLIHIVTQNMVQGPLSPDQPQNLPNPEFLFNFLAERLSKTFPNMSKQLTFQKVGNWFKQLDEKGFKLEVADYLVLINRYTIQDLQENVKDGQK